MKLIADALLMLGIGLIAVAAIVIVILVIAEAIQHVASRGALK